MGPSCKYCGCTDDNCSQCIEKTGEPCYWLEENVCSACFEIDKNYKRLNNLNTNEIKLVLTSLENLSQYVATLNDNEVDNYLKFERLINQKLNLSIDNSKYL